MSVWIETVTEEEIAAPVNGRSMQRIQAHAPFRNRRSAVRVFRIVNRDMNQSPNESRTRRGIRLDLILRHVPDDLDLDLRRSLFLGLAELPECGELLVSVGIASEHADGDGGAASDDRVTFSDEAESVGNQGGREPTKEIEGLGK